MRSLAASVLMIAVLSVGVSQSSHAGYRRELNRATHKNQIYDANTWDAKLMWHATFFSDEFRRAYEQKHVKINHMPALESARFIAEQERIHNEQRTFFVGFYTKSAYKTFSPDPGSFWKIFLKTSEQEVVEPASIEQISITPYELLMYPYLNRWSKAYKVTFPKTELGKTFVLTLESIVGQSTLKWKTK